ncbi:MAG TPA: inositol monophosphatase family protein [Actinomycetes bacterium]|nr:inositol monophosphatase family protein [Actinomycetes bacterium]
MTSPPSSARALTDVADSDWTADLELALELADAAAKVTVAAFGGRQQVRLKDDATPVTEVDAAAEKAIRELLAQRRPDDGVRGEEIGETPGTSGRVWVIDPIDGTRMFAEGVPLWTTLIGLRVGPTGGPVMVGVADAPVLGERYWATSGGGAFCNDRAISVSSVDRLQDSFVLHAAIEEFDRDNGSGIDALRSVIASARTSRGIGDGWAHLLVARGAAEVLVEQGPCFEWDWAATSVIVHEAGGRVSRLEGGPPHDGDHLLVSNGLLEDEVRRVLRSGRNGTEA